MPRDYVLRLRRTDRDGEHLLVNISKHGAKPLDLKLVASEGENVFETTIKESGLKSLQNANYHGNLEDWKAILRFALLQERSDNGSLLSEDLQGLETVGQLNGSTLTITIRRSITGITQRLGSIQLEDSDEEIDVFGWAHTAVIRGDELQDRLSSLQTSVSTHQEQVARLNQQLDDLVKAKRQHEEQLLQKFAALLNAKKLKIRDQQRLLKGAKIDPSIAEEVSSTRNGSSLGTAGPSRQGKRKAQEDAEPALEAVVTTSDQTEDEDDDLEHQEHTPQHSDRDATEDEISDADGVVAAPAASQRSLRGAGNRGKAVESAKTGHTEQVPDDGVLPPRRELPMGKKRGAKVKSKSPELQPTAVSRPEEEEDDDETDDEL
ncbi:DNA double-strand break repair and V(D)J recombination protein XRCC4 [Teratosphaeria destructans]|uniref:DNA double-strand break repair and V(D)J recombination protein XRCC4 n=1 Tax=Teratosphaeria destructans TaxID=418781 RepID=A0A9W7W709_9PEZI|nr:DNA double-strand break repair and V(D)J recombination protein XRCC4 [Teratosphaeria destructans]